MPEFILKHKSNSCFIYLNRLKNDFQVDFDFDLKHKMNSYFSARLKYSPLFDLNFWFPCYFDFGFDFNFDFFSKLPSHTPRAETPFLSRFPHMALGAIWQHCSTTCRLQSFFLRGMLSRSTLFLSSLFI